jgi:Pyridoxamine 5'-phosphate oxidase
MIQAVKWTKEALAARVDAWGLGEELERFADQLDDRERELLQEVLLERSGVADYALRERIDAKGWLRRTLDDAELRGRVGTARRAVPEPTAQRPAFGPDYGIEASADGLLPWSFATERLAAARNYWIVTADADGRPRAAPVWGAWLEDGLWFSTNPRSSKGRNLARDPRVLVHPDGGDEVVILEGDVERVELEERVADTYEAKYEWRPEPSVDGLWYRLRPHAASAWLERDYVRTATRFEFPEAA